MRTYELYQVFRDQYPSLLPYLSILIHKQPTHPYHNAAHVLHVVSEVLDVIHNHNLTEQYSIPMIIAAIFHDMDHRGDTCHDSENIARAQNALEQHLLPVHKEHRMVITEFIAATEFPLDPATLQSMPYQHRLLRDADVSYVLGQDDPITVLRGLAAEKQWSLRDLLLRQEAFLSSCFMTDYFNERFKERIPTVTLICCRIGSLLP